MAKILLINQGVAFLTDALISSLRKAGVEVVQTEPVLENIEREKDSTNLFLLFAGEYVYDLPEILVYLKDICGGEDKSLCVVGYDKEIAEILESIPKGLIARVVRRPFDVKILTGDLVSVLSAEEDRKKDKHILLVDDDVTFLRMMHSWLSTKYCITAVKSGMQALTYIASHTPDLILLDYDMPITPGPQIFEMIKSEPSSARIPVIFLTGKSDRESVLNVMRLKPEGYLLKSMSKEDILESVDHYFASSKWKNLYED